MVEIASASTISTIVNPVEPFFNGDLQMADLRILLNIEISQTVYRYLLILAGLRNFDGLRRNNICRQSPAVKSDLIIDNRQTEAGNIKVYSGGQSPG